MIILTKSNNIYCEACDIIYSVDYLFHCTIFEFLFCKNCTAIQFFQNNKLKGSTVECLIMEENDVTNFTANIVRLGEYNQLSYFVKTVLQYKYPIEFR